MLLTAGALPGSFKNVLDWAVGDDQPGSMNGEPVAYINVSSRGAALTQDSLDEDGLIVSDDIKREVATALAVLVAG